MLATVLGLSKLTRLVFSILGMWKLYSADHTEFFYTYLVVFGFWYLLEVIIMANNGLNVILSLLGMTWFRLPLIVDKQRYRNRIIYYTVVELAECLCGTYLSACICISTDYLPLWIPIVHLIAALLALPLIYEGVVFKQQMIMEVKTYILVIIEHLLTVDFVAVLCTLKNFWIVFLVGLWRVIAFCEPFALWSSLHTVVSPFRGMHISRSARSLIAIFALYMELFFTLYAVAWIMEYKTINIVIVYMYVAYFAIFTATEICSCNLPFTHRVKPITWANVEEPDYFDPAVL